MEGPIVNTAWNAQMRAIALLDHRCVFGIKDRNTLVVFRKKFFDHAINIEFKTEDFNLNLRKTIDLKEMYDFLIYHTNIAKENHALTKEDMYLHMQAIDMVKDEMEARSDYEQTVSRYILNRLIEEKKKELVLLQKALDELPK